MGSCVSAHARELPWFGTETRGGSRWGVEVGWQKWGMRKNFGDLCLSTLIYTSDANHHLLVNLNQILRKQCTAFKRPSPLSQLKAPQSKTEWERISTGQTPRRERTPSSVNSCRGVEFALLLYYHSFIYPIPTNQSRKWKHERWMSNLTSVRWVDW